MNELGATTRECQELTRQLHPILVSLYLCQLRVWYIMVPYLLKHKQYSFNLLILRSSSSYANLALLLLTLINVLT